MNVTFKKWIFIRLISSDAVEEYDLNLLNYLAELKWSPLNVGPSIIAAWCFDTVTYNDPVIQTHLVPNHHRHILNRYTHQHTHSHTLSYTHIHRHSLSLSLSHTHLHSLSHTQSHTLSLTHNHTLYLSHIYTHTPGLTLKRTYNPSGKTCDFGGITSKQKQKRCVTIPASSCTVCAYYSTMRTPAPYVLLLLHRGCLISAACETAAKEIEWMLMRCDGRLFLGWRSVLHVSLMRTLPCAACPSTRRLQGCW